ncbi:alpha/beta fold hydrolase [Enterococcus olivae]
MFLHGLGQTAYAWQPVIDRLPTVDSLVFNLFDQETNEELTLETLSRSVSEKLSAIKEPYVLCGLSLGAILSLQYAIKGAAFLQGVILSAPQFETPPHGLLLLQNTVFRFLPKNFFANIGITKKQMLELMASLTSLDLRSVLSDLALPTMILCGEKDKPNLPAARELNLLIPHSKLEILPNGKHELNMEQPEAFATLTQEFLATITENDRRES